MLSLLGQAQNWALSTPPACFFPHGLASLQTCTSPIFLSWSSFLFPALAAGLHPFPASPKPCRSSSTPRLNRMFSHTVLGWHQCSPVSTDAPPEASQSHGSAALAKREHIWHHMMITLGKPLWAGGAVDVSKAAHGRARCVKQDPWADLGRMRRAEG